MTPTPYLDILLLSLVVIWIVDVSGFTQSWMNALSRWLNRQIRPVKPFACSLCMTWWVGLAWAWFQGSLTLPVVAYIAGLSFFSLTLYELLIFIREVLLIWIRTLNEWLNA